MNPSLIRLLVADDHTVVRNGLAGILNAQADMKVVAEAADGEMALQLFRQQRPDISLLDLSMPKLDGTQTLEAIRSIDPAAKVVVLTTYDTDDDIERVLKAGAKAYLLKDIEPADLVQSIRDVMAGQTAVAPAVAAKLATRLTRVQLTMREMEVLKLISRGDANKEIGNSLHISESTVKLHINALFEKLGVNSRTEAMRVGLERGLIRLR